MSPFNLSTGHPETVFISYSRNDEDFVIPVIKAHQVLEQSAFLDIEDTPPVAAWEELHTARIENAEWLILCWSKNSSSSSRVAREWRHALQSEIPIVPVLLDDTPLHPDLSHIHAIDLRAHTQFYSRTRLYCGPISSSTALLGTFMIGIATTIGLYQMYSFVTHGIEPKGLII
jgi:hypothetical protein